MKNRSEEILLSLHPEYSKCMFCGCFFHTQNTANHLFMLVSVIVIRQRKFQQQTCLMCNIMYAQLSAEKDQRNPKQETLSKCYPPYHIPYRNKNDWVRIFTHAQIRSFFDNTYEKYRLY